MIDWFFLLQIEKGELKTAVLRQAEQQNGNIKLGDVSYRSWRLGSLYDNSSICENGESPRDSCGSNYSEFDPQKNSSTLVSLNKTQF